MNMRDRRNKKRDQRRIILTDIEKRRASSRERRLNWKRFESHIMIEFYLKQAFLNPQLRRDWYNSIPQIAAHISSGNKALEISATKKICFLLNREEPPIDEVIHHGIVPHLLRIMTNNQEQRYDLQCDAALALRRILYGSPAQEKVVMDHGGAASFATLLSSEFEVLKIEAVKSVERIASLSVIYRNALLDLGAATQLVNMVEQDLGLPIVENHKIIAVASALRSICSWYEPPALNLVETIGPTLKRLINFNTEMNFLEVVNDACIALRYLTIRQPVHMDAILDAQLCGRLVYLLNAPSTKIIGSVLEFMRNIFLSTEPSFQTMIESGVLPRLHQFLSGHIGFETLRPNGCSIISSLISGGRDRTQLVLDAGFIQLFQDIAQDQYESLETRHEAVFVLAKAARRGSFEQIEMMVNQGCLEPIIGYLNSEKERTRYICIEGLWSILRKGDANRVNGVHPFIDMFRILNGIVRLEVLQNDARLGARARMMLLRMNQFH